jgi:hypothetical protein
MTEQIQTATKVFISYSWDSDEHKENVLKLANTLRAVWGIDAYIDRYVRAESPYTPVQGWDVWMSERIKWAEFVLIIFTETYQRRFEGNEEPEKGLGVSWEGTIIRNNLYNAQLRDTKFIPVVFSQSDLDYVPLVLNSRDKYVLTDDKSFTELCYRLRKQNTIIKPEIEGGPLPLPPDRVLFSPQKPSVESLETAIKVFISYSWDSNEHKQKVLSLAQTLRDDGILCMIDQFVMSPDNWDRWMLDQIDESQFVLIVCSERYYQRYRGREEVNRGMGVTWESTLIMGQLYNGQGKNGKFYPIFFCSPDRKIIPDGIRTSFYDLSRYDLLNLDRDENRLIKSGGYKDLYSLLTNQPGVVPKKVGSVRKLDPTNQDVLTDHKYPQEPPVKSLEQQQTPEIEYRKKVEEYVNKVPLSEPYYEISETHKFPLERIRQTIELDTDKAKAIENDVLQSRSKLHEEYKQNLQEYHNYMRGILEREGFFSDDILSELNEFQNTLGLRDKDAEELLLYTQLEYSLKRQEWIEADETTKNILLKVANVQQNYFSLTDFQKIPCKDIRKIDKLWTDYSKGNFGYSAQIDIWQQFDGKLFDFFVALDWGFYNEDRRFVYIDYFKYNRSNPPKGHRPVSVLWDGGTHETRQAYIRRIQQCCKDVVR